MKLRRTQLVFVLAIVMVFGFLSGCTEREPIPNRIIDGPDPTPHTEGSIQFSYEANTESKRRAVERYIHAFQEKFPNVEVICDDTYKISTLDQRIAAGTIGDVFQLTESKVYDCAIEQKVLMDLKYYVEAFRIDTDDVYAGVMSSSLLPGDKYYDFYYVVQEFRPMIMVYNKERVYETGMDSLVQKGWTWDRFLEVCGEVTNTAYYGADINLLDDTVFTPLLGVEIGRSNWHEAGYPPRINLSKTGTSAAIEDLIDAYKAGYINLGFGDQSAFKNKEAVFTQCEQDQVVASYGPIYDQTNTDWDMIHLPLANELQNTVFGFRSSGFGVYKYTKNPNAAAAFALFLYTPKGQVAFNDQEIPCVPILNSLAQDKFWQYAESKENDWRTKNWQACVDYAEAYAVSGQLENTRPLEVAGAFEQAWQTNLEAVLQDQLSLQQAMVNIEETVNGTWYSLVRQMTR